MGPSRVATVLATSLAIAISATAGDDRVRVGFPSDRLLDELAVEIAADDNSFGVPNHPVVAGFGTDCATERTSRDCAAALLRSLYSCVRSAPAGGLRIRRSLALYLDPSLVIEALNAASADDAARCGMLEACADAEHRAEAILARVLAIDLLVVSAQPSVILVPAIGPDSETVRELGRAFARSCAGKALLDALTRKGARSRELAVSMLLSDTIAIVGTTVGHPIGPDDAKAAALELRRAPSWARRPDAALMLFLDGWRHRVASGGVYDSVLVRMRKSKPPAHQPVEEWIRAEFPLEAVEAEELLGRMTGR